MDFSEAESTSSRLPGVTFAGAVVYSDANDEVRIEGHFGRAEQLAEICGNPYVKARGSHVIFNVYDRHGLVEQIYRNYSWDPNASWSIDVSLTGEYPHIIIGDQTQCIGITHLLGFEADMAKTLWSDDDGLFSYADKDEVDQKLVEVVLEVPVGETTIEASWAPSEFVWRVLQPGLDVQEGQTPGTLEFRASSGFLARSFDVSWTGRWQDKLAGPAFLYPGTYSLDLELDRPALTPTKWLFLVNVAEFDSRICALDIEWSICSQS